MEEKDFVSYEYKTITTKANNQTKVMDLYEAFGWEISETTPTSIDSITISLKRDRKQKHKQELVRLERQAENIFTTIQGLENSKTLGASIFSYILGFISTTLIGIGIYLIILQTIPTIVSGILLGIIGTISCLANYFIYKKISTNRIQKVLPIIDDNEDALANVLEKGNNLLKADIS